MKKSILILFAAFAFSGHLSAQTSGQSVIPKKNAGNGYTNEAFTLGNSQIAGRTAAGTLSGLSIGSGLTLTGSTLTASGGAFSTLSDVTLTSLASGDFLKWSGTAWINRTAADARSDLGLGTLATQSATITDYLTSATAATTYQPLDADLTTLASATAAGLALMDDASASAQRTTLGLGTIVTQAASAVAITGGTLSGITSFTIANTGILNAASASRLTLPVTAIGTNGALALVSIANGGSGYELHYGDKDGVDRTVMTLDYAQTPTNKTISGATNTITDINASNLASGTVATARLGSGTADNTTYLRGDSTWQTISTGLTIDTTAISGGTIGNLLFHKTGNVLGELTTTGSGTVVVLATSPSISGTLSAGASNTVSGTNAVALGSSNTASGNYSVAAGNGNSVSCLYGFAAGVSNTNASGSGTQGNIAGGQSVYFNPSGNTQGSIGLGHTIIVQGTQHNGLLATGYSTYARHYNERIHGVYAWGYQTPVQFGETALSASTTDATPVEGFIDGSAATKRFTLLAGQTYDVEIKIVGRKSDGSQSASYWRRACIQRTSTTTALVGTVQTIGTDIEDDAAWDVTVTADDTNDALKITFTGAAATNIRWMARLDFSELNY